MAEKTIEIKDLVVEYRTRSGVVQALNGLSLSIEKGKTLGLVGETGAGKTTAGLAVLGLIPSPPGVIVSGEILLNGKDLRALTDKEMDQIRGDAVAMIFQDPMTSLNPVMTVGDQIAEAIKIHEGLNHGDALKKAEEMLEMVGIPRERAKEYPHQFSGGMKQRVVIAIALSCTPGLLIADEPTTALDVTIQAQILEMMKGLKEKYEMSMLMITHDLGIVAEICDEVSVVYAGRVVEHGTLADVFDNTRHPYTEGLFNSLPNIENQAEKLKPIRGLMPDPTDLPLGCPFYPRCDHAMEICRTKKPPKVYRNETHFVECHLYNEQNIGDKEEKWR
ncbi:MAG: ABC transporter ATP-binding protein [Lachnospiraceae bacterium]